MATNTRERSDVFQQAARRLLEDQRIDVTTQVDWRLLAADLVTQTGCHIDTAERHILKAVRLMRGETTKEWGGKREGAGLPPQSATVKLGQFVALQRGGPLEPATVTEIRRGSVRTIVLTLEGGEVVRLHI